MTILNREIAKQLFEKQGKNIIIPNIYTSISAYAFQSLHITSIQIPKGIKTIGNSAFRYNQLTSVVIPEGVKAIEWGAFMNNKLSDIVIPEGVETIGKYAFNDNDLTTVYLPMTVNSIGQFAFQRNPLKYAEVAEGAAIDETVFPTFTQIEFSSNKAPSDIQISENNFDENILKNSVVATLSTIDPDSEDIHTYSFEPGDGNEDNGKFWIDGNEIKIIDSPDYETKSLYSIRLKTSDAGGQVFEKEFKLVVNDINEKPTNLHLSNRTLGKNTSYETFVATLSTTDPDSEESHIYSFRSGNGEGEDNNKFMIKGNQLFASPKFETKESYSIRLRTTDSEGLGYTKTFKLIMNDENEFNIISSAIGKGKLEGTKNADQFTFDQFETFGRETADKIIKFKPSHGDTIGVSAEAFPSLLGTDEISFASASTKRELKLLSKENYDFVYFEENGRLFFNGNGDKRGWGDPEEGGFFAILKNKPEISSDDFILLT